MATQSAVKERTKNKVREPKRFNVIMHNDDVTSMQFVVRVLMDIFHKDQPTAEMLMLKVHKTGSAVIGTYTYDKATTRVMMAMTQARMEGFPFKMTIEEAN